MADVRLLAHHDEFADAGAVLDTVWGPVTEPVVSRELMLVLSRTGGYVAGAYEAGRMVAASVGLLAADPLPDPSGDGEWRTRPVLHSHVTAVLPEARPRRVGAELKQHQRAWAAERGLPAITWTFDPLVRRNAHLNLAKLGASVVRYVEDFYGELADAINAGDPTDRLLLRWDVSLAGGPDLAGPASGAAWALAVRDDGQPREQAVTGGGPVLVAVPEDVETLRRDRPDRALAWRHAVREQLGGRLHGGWRVAGFHDRTAYLLVPDEEGA